MLIIIIAIITIVQSVQWSSNIFNKHLIKNAVIRNALCNDGSSAGGYFSSGFGDGQNKWIIYLAGGRWCWDENSCKHTYERNYGTNNNSFISSNNWPTQTNFIGIMSPDLNINDFYNWNRIYIKYCSSDVYSGTSQNYENNMNYYFHGSNIVSEMLKDFTNTSIVNDTLDCASDIIVSGSSAGGLGVMIHLNKIKDMFPNAIVKGLCDAGWLISINSNNVYDIFKEEIAKGMILWKPNFINYHNYIPENLYTNIKNIPLYIVLNNPDGFMVLIANHTKYDQNIINEIMEQNLKSLLIVDSYFVSNCEGMHNFIGGGNAETTSNLWNAIKVNNISLRNAFYNWYTNDMTNYKLIDNCHETNIFCTKDCVKWPNSLF